MTRYSYSSYGNESAKIVVYPETSDEEDIVSEVLGHLDDMYYETYSSCWSWDGNTECWGGFALDWDDTFLGVYTNWTDLGDFASSLDSVGFTDEQIVHLGLLNDASNASWCGGSFGRSPYCDGKRPNPGVDMTCQNSPEDTAATAAQETNHCLIYKEEPGVQDLTGPNDDQHSLGKFFDAGSRNECTPMICGYGANSSTDLTDTGHCRGDAESADGPHLSFTNCTHYAIAESEGYCK